jgi:hypothetical protein
VGPRPTDRYSRPGAPTVNLANENGLIHDKPHAIDAVAVIVQHVLPAIIFEHRSGIAVRAKAFSDELTNVISPATRA